MQTQEAWSSWSDYVRADLASHFLSYLNFSLAVGLAFKGYKQESEKSTKRFPCLSSTRWTFTGFIESKGDETAFELLPLFLVLLKILLNFPVKVADSVK